MLLLYMCQNRKIFMNDTLKNEREREQVVSFVDMPMIYLMMRITADVLNGWLHMYKTFFKCKLFVHHHQQCIHTVLIPL